MGAQAGQGNYGEALLLLGTELLGPIGKEMRGLRRGGKGPEPKYAPRVRARGVQDPVSHNFPYSFDADILNTTPILRPDGYKIYQAPGSMTGSVITDIEAGVRTQTYKNGVFEIGVNKDGIIDHRFFRPDK